MKVSAGRQQHRPGIAWSLHAAQNAPTGTAVAPGLLLRRTWPAGRRRIACCWPRPGEPEDLQI